jgi:hypothetical protein
MEILTAPVDIGKWLKDGGDLNTSMLLKGSLNIFVSGWMINVLVLGRIPTDQLGMLLSGLAQIGYGYFFEPLESK